MTPVRTIDRKRVAALKKIEKIARNDLGWKVSTVHNSDGIYGMTIGVRDWVALIVELVNEAGGVVADDEQLN